jgi:DNA-binding SARP family transcriptional activator/WD40 repeat protein
MEFRVLGPLEVLADGKAIPLDAPKQRAILAVLLIHANEVVSTDRLMEAVWAEEQPSGGPRTLRYHIFKLREALPADVIRTRAPGYVLEVSPSRVDALLFQSLLAEARDIRATDRSGALKRLDEALGLWRGSPYADFTYDDFAHSEIRSLHELQLRAMEDRFDICIELGRASEILSELQRLVEEHPRRERLTGALMLGLYKSGRQAEALSAFGDLRRELGEGLGIEPSKVLQDLEERILLQDISLDETAPAPAAEFLRGYVLRGRIGEGAHGVVWRAGQPGVGREVAIKAIHPDISNRPGFVRRFEMEAQLVASLEHPHIVSLFDFWRDPEGAYLVMPYLRGGDLDHLLRQGPLRPETALELIRAIGGALAYAHRRGIIHRDVTPHNVLLDDEGHPYLADFGVATLIGETGPPISSSPAYLSPELHAGKGAAPQSDVYSLGVLTHSVLTGQAPAEGERLPPVLSYRSDLAEIVDEIIEVATSIDMAERYDSPEDLVADLGRALGAAAPAAVAPAIETRNPYKGLRAFAETDAGDFFGRDVLESELVDAVFRHRLVGVVGPSGCGKSSLVRAGLIPLLRRGVLPGSDDWLITDMYPGAQPFSEMQAALLRVAVDLPPRLGERLAGDAADRKSLLGELLPADTELLLIVDQFEELFTLTADEETRSRFLGALVDFAGDPLNRVRLVVTLRADFYDRPLEYPEFAELLRRGLVTIAVPGQDGLLKAVTGPAHRVGLEVEPGLAERITHDVAGQPGGLPLLEYALTELFQRRTESRLTLAGYEQTGGVLGALGRRAEDLYTGRDEVGQQAVQQVFLRLVTVEEGSADTRRRIPLGELRGMGLDPDALQEVLDDYGSHRLLTFDRDPATRAPTVEVAHEALLIRWDRLRVWIDDRRDDLVLHRRLAASLAEWRDTGERPEYLLGRGRLEHFEAFAAESDIALTNEESDYLAQSRAHADHLAGRRRRRRRAIMAGFGIAAIIATVFAVVAFLSQRRAEDEAVRARASSLIAFAAEALEEDPEVSILLLLEAIDMARETPGTISALHEAVLTDRLLMRLPGEFESGVLSPRGDLLVVFGDETVAALAVPSGDVIWQEEQNPDALISGGVFTLDGGRFLAVPEDTADIHAIDMATHGRTVYPVDWPYPLDNVVGNSSRLVDPALPLIVRARGAEAEIPSRNEVVALRVELADGSAEVVATFLLGELDGGYAGQWSTDRDVRHLALSRSLKTTVLDLETREVETYGGEADYSSTALLSPDGSRVVTSSRVRNDVWNIDTDTKEWGFFRAETSSAVFTPDGSKLAVGNELFDAMSGELLIAVPDQGWDTSMSADGSRLFTSTGVWDLGPRGEVGTIDLPIGGFYGLFTDIAGGYGAALDLSENKAYAFEVESGEVFHSADGATFDAAISPDGRLLAYQEVVGTTYGQVVVVDLQSQQEQARLTDFCLVESDTAWGPDCRFYPEVPFPGFPDDLEFTADGRHLVGMFQVVDEVGIRRAVAAWDLEQGQRVYWTEAGDFAPPASSPDGKLLAVADWDAETVDIVDIATWSSIGQVPQPGFVRFASNESVVLINDGLTVYNWTDGTEIRSGPQGCDQRDYAVSPDGAILAMSCAGEARVVIHDLDSLEVIQEITTGTEPIRGISFVDDTHLLVFPKSGPGLILTTDIDELTQVAREGLTRDFTDEECEAYKIDPCPAQPEKGEEEFEESGDEEEDSEA